MGRVWQQEETPTDTKISSVFMRSERGDSNPHGMLSHRILSPGRLPSYDTLRCWEDATRRRDCPELICPAGVTLGGQFGIKPWISCCFRVVHGFGHHVSRPLSISMGSCLLVHPALAWTQVSLA